MGWRDAAAGSRIAVSLSMTSGVGVDCRVSAAEGGSELVRLASVSMRDAQREITEQLIRDGFRPLNRWLDNGVDNPNGEEAVRDFVRN
jgi:hypothetical protein